VIDKLEHIAGKTDIATGVAAVTSPLWLRWLEYGAAAYIAIGGIILITIRVAIAYRNWRRKQGD
jgi:predicted ferric reductase